VLAEDATTDQCPHQPAERIGIRAHPDCQIVQAQRSVLKSVGDAELGGRVNRLGYPRPQKQIRYCDRRGRQSLMKSIHVVAHMLDKSDQSCGRNFGSGRHGVA
jgi:hypothetical protein